MKKYVTHAKDIINRVRGLGIKEFLIQELGSGASIHNLALSCCVGVYIACSPFIGGHTIMMLASWWFLGLNLPVLFFATSINNPWTMVPFFMGEYLFGHWFLHDFLNIHPSWTISFAKIFGSGSVCLWSFFVGCNILGVVFGVLAYPVMYIIFKKIKHLSRDS